MATKQADDAPNPCTVVESVKTSKTLKSVKTLKTEGYDTLGPCRGCGCIEHVSRAGWCPACDPEVGDGE